MNIYLASKKIWLKQSPKKRNLNQNINDSKSHIWIFHIFIFQSHIWNFFFWKYYFGFWHATFPYSSTLFNGHCQNFLLLFKFSRRKSQSQQKPAKKFTHFTIQFCSQNLTHFMKLNSLDIENNMLLQQSQKPFSLYKFFSQNFSVWC